MTTTHLRPVWIVCVLLAATIGCNQPAASKEKPAAEAKASATACADYAKKVCDEAGAESGSCNTFKAATELMPASACAAGLAEFAATKSKLGEAKKSCTDLEKKLCADLGEETQTCEMVKTQTKSFPPERCSMMLSQYDNVLADLKKMEERNKPLSEEMVAAIAKSDAASFGPADAKVTIVEFSDFECPFCSRAANTATEIKKKYGDQVRFVFRHFPLSFHKKAHLASQAALAANAQGKFWEYHDKLFADQKQLDRPALEASAKELGLDVAAFKKALDDGAYKAAVDADLELGGKVNITGTPTMFLNGKRLADPTNFDAVSKMIDSELAG